MSSPSLPTRLVIATRESRLALWQAEHIRSRLQALYPACEVVLLGMTTRGDQILDRPLSKIGGKGLFVKELEVAMVEGRADLAVHSMKDVPMQLPDEFTLACITERETPLDAFVSNRYESLADMPPGAVVGTSSLRREAQLHAQHPYLGVHPLRGNLDTRLRKLDEGQFDAIILAAAGLKRLGLGARIRSTLSVEDSLPAPGQGALGIEIGAHRADLLQWLAPLNHPQTQACVTAERAVSRTLGGSCEVPLGAYAHIAGGVLTLEAFVAQADGSQILRARQQGAPGDADALGVAAAQQLMDQGAEAVLAQGRMPFA